jgi:hypothetical protein
MKKTRTVRKLGLLILVLCSSFLLSGCFGAFSTDRGMNGNSGKSYLTSHQLCEFDKSGIHGSCTDNLDRINYKVDQLTREHLGHGRIYAATGSVYSVGQTCPICKAGTLTHVYTQYFPFNPEDEDDNDDTPHEADLGNCDNASCTAHGLKHRLLPGSARPKQENKSDAEESDSDEPAARVDLSQLVRLPGTLRAVPGKRIPGTHVVFGRAMITLPDLPTIPSIFPGALPTPAMGGVTIPVIGVPVSSPPPIIPAFP